MIQLNITSSCDVGCKENFGLGMATWGRTNKGSSAHMKQSDLDSALNELGMLSGVTESRRQYLRESARRAALTRQRQRYLSEPQQHSTATPSNSPVKPRGYKVVRLNEAFVTSLGSCSKPPSLSSAAAPSFSEEKITNDQKSVVNQALQKGPGKQKLSRLKKFRKPYEVPWRHSIETCYGLRDKFTFAQNGVSSRASSSSDSVTSQADFLRPDERARGSSNQSTPEKASRRRRQNVTVTRSRSLDDLDLSKLRLAEKERDYAKEKRDIESVSANLKNLNLAIND